MSEHVTEAPLDAPTRFVDFTRLTSGSVINAGKIKHPTKVRLKQPLYDEWQWISAPAQPAYEWRQKSRRARWRTPSASETRPRQPAAFSRERRAALISTRGTAKLLKLQP